jgi:hypothetical protein
MCHVLRLFSIQMHGSNCKGTIWITDYSGIQMCTVFIFFKLKSVGLVNRGSYYQLQTFSSIAINFLRNYIKIHRSIKTFMDVIYVLWEKILLQNNCRNILHEKSQISMKKIFCEFISLNIDNIGSRAQHFQLLTLLHNLWD